MLVIFPRLWTVLSLIFFILGETAFASGAAAILRDVRPGISELVARNVNQTSPTSSKGITITSVQSSPSTSNQATPMSSGGIQASSIPTTSLASSMFALSVSSMSQPSLSQTVATMSVLAAPTTSSTSAATISPSFSLPTSSLPSSTSTQSIVSKVRPTQSLLRLDAAGATSVTSTLPTTTSLSSLSTTTQTTTSTSSLTSTTTSSSTTTASTLVTATTTAATTVPTVATTSALTVSSTSLVTPTTTLSSASLSSFTGTTSSHSTASKTSSTSTVSSTFPAYPVQAAAQTPKLTGVLIGVVSSLSIIALVSLVAGSCLYVRRRRSRAGSFERLGDMEARRSSAGARLVTVPSVPPTARRQTVAPPPRPHNPFEGVVSPSTPLLPSPDKLVHHLA